MVKNVNNVFPKIHFFSDLLQFNSIYFNFILTLINKAKEL